MYTGTQRLNEDISSPGAGVTVVMSCCQHKCLGIKFKFSTKVVIALNH